MKQNIFECKYLERRSEIRSKIKDTKVQFKIFRVDKNLQVFKENYDKQHVPNSLENRPGYHIMSFIEDEIQYGKLNKEDKICHIKNELKARSIDFNETET